ncbi:MAG TPA: ribose-phosphate pyrophosphokinase [Allosphingosinicella sp.]|nr:ribose-phosphate pyrophosphokinase [Allosphingosinicella sp.]
MPALATPEEVRFHLVAAARAGAALTYSECLERLGYAFSRPKMRALCAILGAVDQDAAARGEPELAVLVVRQSDGIPGQGWWVAGGARAHDYAGPWEGPEAKSFIAAVQAATFHWWQSRRGTGEDQGAC